MGTFALPFFVTDLRGSLPTFSVTADVKGYSVAGDGGGGLFHFDPTSPLSDNGGTVIKPTAAGATGRWLRIYSGSLDIRWFGATTADLTGALNSTAITAAIAAAGNGASSADVYVPVGTFLIASTLSIPAGIAVRGAGPNSVLQAAGSVSISAITLGGELHNLVVDGSATSGGSVIDGVVVAPTIVTSQPIMQSVEVAGFKVAGSAGLKVSQAVGFIARACYFAANDIGVHTIGNSLPTVGSFDNCFFQSNTTYGLWAETLLSTTFRGCVFEGNGNSGVFLDGAGNVDVHFDSSCWFETNCTHAGIYEFVANNARFTVRDTFFSGVATKAISITGSSDFVLDNIQPDHDAQAGTISIASGTRGYVKNPKLSTALPIDTVYAIASPGVFLDYHGQGWSTWAPTLTCSGARGRLVYDRQRDAASGRFSEGREQLLHGARCGWEWCGCGADGEAVDRRRWQSFDLPRRVCVSVHAWRRVRGECEFRVRAGLDLERK